MWIKMGCRCHPSAPGMNKFLTSVWSRERKTSLVRWLGGKTKTPRKRWTVGQVHINGAQKILVMGFLMSLDGLHLRTLMLNPPGSFLVLFCSHMDTPKTLRLRGCAHRSAKEYLRFCPSHGLVEGPRLGSLLLAAWEKTCSIGMHSNPGWNFPWNFQGFLLKTMGWNGEICWGLRFFVFVFFDFSSVF